MKKNKAYSTKKNIIIRKRVVKRKPAKYVEKRERKRLCDKCRQRFKLDELVVHHKEDRRSKIMWRNTEGIPARTFDRMYANKQKRSAHERRDNIVIMCSECYSENKKNWRKAKK